MYAGKALMYTTQYRFVSIVDLDVHVLQNDDLKVLRGTDNLDV